MKLTKRQQEMIAHMEKGAVVEQGTLRFHLAGQTIPYDRRTLTSLIGKTLLWVKDPSVGWTLDKRPKLSQQAKEALENPPFAVEELVVKLETTPEHLLTEFGVVARLMLARYIRELEAHRT